LIQTTILASLLLFGPVAAAQAEVTLDTPAKQVFLVDDTTGAVLFEKDGYAQMPPASMSKLMTIYMLFERLAAGGLKLDDTLPVSEKAWRMGGSKMFVEVGKRVKVEDLIRGIVVQSGNDACIVVAEGLAGTESAFADLMNEKARQLGLEDSIFANSTGWPDPNQMMSPRDLATLARRLIHDFPQYYHYFKETNFTYNKIRQGNRNPLLYKNMGSDGLKTGHTEASGYGLTASATRGDRRLVLVTNGLDSVSQRARESERLLEWGFREFDNYRLAKAGETIESAEVWLGAEASVPLVAEEDVIVTLRRTSRKNVKASVVYDGPLPAPVEEGAEVARLIIASPDMKPTEIPLFAGESVEQLGFIGRLFAALGHLVWGAAVQQ
jgi:D-alanyl-D-alanine carboxypeptidase (penicillin-binding protein 5/6)